VIGLTGLTDFRFGQAELYKASNWGESGAMLGTDIGLALPAVWGLVSKVGLLAKGITTTATVTTVEAETISSEARLAEHLESAIADAQTSGLTPRQLARVAENPSLRIDYFFKQSVMNDDLLMQRGFQVTPRFKFGPDVFNPTTNTWYDVTTRLQWQKHVIKYESQFGQGSGLFHR
jgi:hypothetical protein